MKYFAYGSNLDTKQLLDRKVKFTVREAGKLMGSKLVFNKKADKGDFTYANIEKTNDGDIVEGAIYDVDEADLKELDKYEGYPKHYDKVEVEVLDSNNEKVKAIAYVAKPEKIVSGLKPKKEYLDHILAGKDIVSREYFDDLSQTETCD